MTAPDTDISTALVRASHEVEHAGQCVHDLFEVLGETEKVSIRDRRSFKGFLEKARVSLEPISERVSAGLPCGDGAELLRVYQRLRASVLSRLSECEIFDDHRGHTFDVHLETNID